MKGFVSWLSAKMAVLLFGVALFAVMVSLYNVAYDYHQKALLAGDASLVRETMRLMPENGEQNITLSENRTVSVKGSPCVLEVGGVRAVLDWAECSDSSASGKTITLKKQSGVTRVD